MDNKQILDAIKEMNVLDLAELVKEIEETFEIEIPEEKAEKIRTVGEAVELIRKTRNE